MMSRLSRAQLDEVLSVQLGWLRDFLLKLWSHIQELKEHTFGPRMMEGVVGVALMVVSVAAVVLFICLCTCYTPYYAELAIYVYCSCFMVRLTQPPILLIQWNLQIAYTSFIEVEVALYQRLKSVRTFIRRLCNRSR